MKFENVDKVRIFGIFCKGFFFQWIIIVCKMLGHSHSVPNHIAIHWFENVKAIFSICRGFIGIFSQNETEYLPGKIIIRWDDSYESISFLNIINYQTGLPWRKGFNAGAILFLQLNNKRKMTSFCAHVSYIMLVKEITNFLAKYNPEE